MGNIPIPELPGVESRPMPTPYFNLDTRGLFGEAVAEGLRGLAKGGDAMSEMATKAKQEAQHAQLAQADSQYGDVHNSTMFDPNKGFLAQQGEHAVKAYEPLFETLAKARKTIADGIDDPQVRDAFLKRAQILDQQTYRQASAHQAQQIQSAKLDKVKALEDTATQSVANAATIGDEETFNTQRELFKQHVDQLSGWEGKGVETKLSMRADVDRKLAGTYLRTLIAASDHRPGAGQQARDFYERHKEELGEDAAKFAGPVADAGLKSDSETLLSQLEDAATPKSTKDDPSPPRWRNAAQMRRGAAAIPDDQPELKERVRALVANSIQVDKQEQETSARNQEAIANAAFERRSALGDVPAETWAYLNDPRNGEVAVAAMQRLKRLAESQGDRWRARAERVQPDSRSQKDALAGFLDRMALDKPTTIATDPATLRAQARDAGVSERGLDHVSNEHLQIRAAAANAKPGENLPSTDREQIFSAGREQGLFPKKNDKETKAGDPGTWGDATTPTGQSASDLYFRVANGLQSEVAAHIRAGKAMTPQEKTAWINDQLQGVEYVEPGKIYDSTIKTARADAEAAGKAYRVRMEGVPPQERAQVAAAAKAAGHDPNDPTVLSAIYEQAHGRTANLPAPSVAAPAKPKTGWEGYMAELERDPNEAAFPGPNGGVFTTGDLARAMDRYVPSEIRGRLTPAELAQTESALKEAMRRFSAGGVWSLPETGLPWETVTAATTSKHTDREGFVHSTTGSESRVRLKRERK